MWKSNILVFIMDKRVLMLLFTAFILAHPVPFNADTNRFGASQTSNAQEIVFRIKETNNPPLIKSRMAALAQLIADGTITIEESAKIVRNTPRFFNSLIDVRSHANPIEVDAADASLRSITLQWVNLLNNLHGEPDRFQSLAKSDPSQLYTLLVYTQNEIYASSFMGVFKRLIRQMEAESISGDDLLRNVGYNRYNKFIEMLVTYNRLHVFLGTMDTDSQTFLLKKYISEMKDNRDRINYSVVIADAFEMIKNPEVLRAVQDTIRALYIICDTKHDREGKMIFGLLADVYGQRPLAWQSWFESISDQYQLLDSRNISIKNLFGQGGACIQQYYFHDDKEGQLSYKYFISQYKKKAGWKIVNKGAFAIIRSPVKNGRRIEIYANRPGYFKAGVDQIRLFLEEKKLHVNIAVHRAHSYQAYQTLKEVSPDILLMFWGSCEGYRESFRTFSKCSRLVGLISTRGVTNSYINEIIGQKLNDELINCKTGAFNLNEYWGKMEKDPRLRKEPDFYDFVDPRENYGVRLSRTLIAHSIGIPDAPGTERQSPVPNL